MRPKKRLLLPALLTALLVLLLLPAAAAAAPSQQAQFKAVARGGCLVDLPDGSGGRAYVETATGSLNAQGNGLVSTPWSFKGVPVYALDPTTLRVNGQVSANWAHDGVSYQFRARLSATEDTDTFLGTGEDYIILGTSEGEDWTTLDYRGVFVVDGQQSQLSGGCCVVRGPNTGIDTVTIKFIIPGYEPFGLVWAEEEGTVDLWGPYLSPIPCPAADVFTCGTHVTKPHPAGNAVVVGTSPDYPPFESLQDGEIVGFDIDLVREIASRAGFRVEFRANPFESLISGLRLEPPAFDMVASSTKITPWREEIIDFSDPYYFSANDPSPYQYYGFGFPTGSPLRLEVNSALQQIKSDGTYVKIYRKWFGTDPIAIP